MNGKILTIFGLWRPCRDKRMIVNDFMKPKSCWKSLEEVGGKSGFWKILVGGILVRESGFFEAFREGWRSGFLEAFRERWREWRTRE